MAGQHLADWFLPGDGIRREVISRDIQAFLGPDATVRPGEKTDDNGNKEKGFVIRAYRNFTTSMVNDLKDRSKKYERQLKKAERRANEDPRVYQDLGPQYDAGKHSPMVEAPYQQPPSRHGHHQDMMDYEATPSHSRNDPYSRNPVPDPRQLVGAHGERAVYAPPAHSPTGYVVPSDPYAADPGYRQSTYPPSVYPGHPGYPDHGPEPVDPRYSRREDHHYPPRDDQRYAPREDQRYQGTREDSRYHHHDEMRHRSSREDPRYAYGAPREEPRYPPQPDPRDDPRYHQSPREDPHYQQIAARQAPRPQPGYQDQAHSARYGYPVPPPPGSMPPGPIPGMPQQMPNPAPFSPQPPPPGSSYPPGTIFDQFGRPVAFAASPIPPPPQEVYQATQSRAEVKYPNSSRKRGAPGEDPSRHRHRG